MTSPEERPAPAEQPYLRDKFLRNAAWSAGLRWTVKTVGLVSTAFLARLLTPADFGLVAMAMIVINLVDVWSDIGVEFVLIQTRHPTVDAYNTAWTLRLLQGVVVGSIVAAIAPLAAWYFKEPRVTVLLWVFAAAPILSGLRNIGTVEFRKELRQDREFKLVVSSKLLTFVVTLTCAWYLRSYWALAIGMLLGSAIEVAGSYLIHPFRPRLGLVGARAFRGYWIATLSNGLGHFSEAKLDELLVGRFGSTATMGIYSLASELGQLPVSEVAAPLNRTLVPTMSKLQGDAPRMRVAFLNYLRALAFLVVPAGVGLAMVSGPFVRVVLGEQWVASALVMQVLAIFGILRASELAVANALVGIGRPGLSARLAWISVGALLVGGLALAPRYGITGIAVARLAAGVCILAAAFFTMVRILHFEFGKLLRCYLRPCVCAAIMALAVSAVGNGGGSAYVILAMKIATGIIVYFTAAFALWHLSGRPDGGERLVAEQFAQMRNAIAARRSRARRSEQG